VKRAIEAALAQLLNKPLWAAGRAGSITWLHFGERHTVADSRSGTKVVGSYALHLDCPWSWTRSWGDLVADQDTEHDELESLDLLPVPPTAVEAGDDGSFRLSFGDGSTLSVEPEPGAEIEEYWRFFEPHRETRHFVVGPNGVED